VASKSRIAVRVNHLCVLNQNIVEDFSHVDLNFDLKIIIEILQNVLYKWGVWIEAYYDSRL
jgi:hypothetical protein